MVEVLFEWLENIGGIKECVGYHHSLSPQRVPEPSSLGAWGPVWLSGKVFVVMQRSCVWAALYPLFFPVGVLLGKALQLMKLRKDMNNVHCRHDVTRILLKAA